MTEESSELRLKAHVRNGTIDVYRLLYALVIMAGHSVTVGSISPFPFESVGIFVEFFLFLTGYFTCDSFGRHRTKLTLGLEKPSEDNGITDAYFGNALKYTFKKFVAFLPYIIVSVGLSYSIDLISQIKNGGVLDRLQEAYSICFRRCFC